ncbi:MAG TPA: hypothetical protein VFH94_28300 [Streptomyces sp.]|nr:hypothetical protein [Streptomyces sp.]
MSTTLMTYAGPGQPDTLATRTGGTPLAPAGTAWPTCAECDGPMQFLAHIILDDQARPVARHHTQDALVMAIFMCQNDPGLCDEWSPTAGGNRALLFSCHDLRPMSVPDPGEDPSVLHLGAVHAVTATPSSAADYEGAREAWVSSGNSPRNVMGQLGGQPSWLQADETPACPACVEPMHLVAQFEEGPDHTTAINFGGGGTAFAFACGPCLQAAFLWQS